MKSHSILSDLVGATQILAGCAALSFGCAEPSLEVPERSVARLDTNGSDNATSWADERVTSLIARMTLAEKIGQLQHDAPAIERLELPAYNYWSEALHGVMTGRATSFPSPIALGASWDPALVERVATAISDEARGIRVRDGKGLTYWSPVINMLRDPRWGRYDESYTEDPHLMSRMGVAFVKGLQGNDPKYLKAVATPKHYALNNSEYNRHTGSSEVDEQVLREYYLPAFEATVMEGGAFSVMSAYNRVNGIPASANTQLLQQILRGEWGFTGYVVSDCDAVADIVSGHHWVQSLPEASGKALRAGTDLNCGSSYPNALGDAITQGFASEADVDRALTRVLRARFLLGEFDPEASVPYRSITPEVVESAAHAELAREAARRSIVLLKNAEGLLPLDRTKVRSVALIGPHAADVTLGSYSGNPTHQVSALAAFQSSLATNSVTVAYELGTTVTGPKDAAAFDRAVSLARSSDVAVVFLGTNLEVFREEQDRPDWALPGAQGELIEAIYAANPKTVLVLTTGGPLGIDWAKEHVPAIVTDFYAGQEQGAALFDVLFGAYNPGGKLSTTWYKRDATLPPIGDYDVRKGRTYLYYADEPLYPFGHGLSYTTFEYGSLEIAPTTLAVGAEATAQFELSNRGTVAGDEVAQLYVRRVDAGPSAPLQQLRGFERVHLEPGASSLVTFAVKPRDLARYDVSRHAWQVEAGQYELRVGASSADIRAVARLTVAESGGAGGAGGTGGADGADTSGPAGTGGSLASAPSTSSTKESQTSGSGCDCVVANRPSSRVALPGLLFALLLSRRRRARRGASQ